MKMQWKYVFEKNLEETPWFYKYEDEEEDGDEGLNEKVLEYYNEANEAVKTF